MKKILQCLGTAIYSTISSYLLWLLFYWLTPLLMNASWIYIIIIGGVITMLIAPISSILVIPIMYLVKQNTIAKIINIIPFAFHGYSAIRLIWGLDGQYGILQYIIGIGLTITVFIAFLGMITMPFSMDKD